MTSCNPDLQSTFEIPAKQVIDLAVNTMLGIETEREEKFAAFCDQFRKDNTRPALFFGLIPAKTCTKTNAEIRAMAREEYLDKEIEIDDCIFYMRLRVDCGLYAYSKQMGIAKMLKKAAETALTTNGADAKMQITVSDYEWIK